MKKRLKISALTCGLVTIGLYFLGVFVATITASIYVVDLSTITIFINEALLFIILIVGFILAQSSNKLVRHIGYGMYGASYGVYIIIATYLFSNNINQIGVGQILCILSVLPFITYFVLVLVMYLSDKPKTPKKKYKTIKVEINDDETTNTNEEVPTEKLK